MSKYIKDLREGNHKDKKLKIEYVSPLILKPNTYNPNKHNVLSFDLLIQSIKLFGFTQPIVVRKGTNEIVDGEHRWRVSSILNYDEIPVIFLELNDNEMRIATIIHNRAKGMENSELINKIEKSLKDKIDFDKIMLKNHNENIQ
jgi:ParB/RepB/Spo0J family partition protein